MHIPFIIGFTLSLSPSMLDWKAMQKKKKCEKCEKWGIKRCKKNEFKALKITVNVKYLERFLYLLFFFALLTFLFLCLAWTENHMHSINYAHNSAIGHFSFLFLMKTLAQFRFVFNFFFLLLFVDHKMIRVKIDWTDFVSLLLFYVLLMVFENCQLRYQIYGSNQWFLQKFNASNHQIQRIKASITIQKSCDVFPNVIQLLYWDFDMCLICY